MSPSLNADQAQLFVCLELFAKFIIRQQKLSLGGKELNTNDNENVSQQKIFSSTKLKHFLNLSHTVKPVLSSHSKIDKTKVLKPCGSLMWLNDLH